MYTKLLWDLKSWHTVICAMGGTDHFQWETAKISFAQSWTPAILKTFEQLFLSVAFFQNYQNLFQTQVGYSQKTTDAPLYLHFLSLNFRQSISHQRAKIFRIHSKLDKTRTGWSLRMKHILDSRRKVLLRLFNSWIAGSTRKEIWRDFT